MNLAILFGITFLAFLLVVAFMAVGVMAGRREISGSCGGLGQGAEGNREGSCSLCSNPEGACRELSKRMEGADRGELTDEDSSNTDLSKAVDGDHSSTRDGSGKETIDTCERR